ncbi:MAG: hypothetical protein M1823_008994, partial [Watsoniomyces obsoletus]
REETSHLPRGSQQSRRYSPWGTALYFIITVGNPWADLREPQDDEEIKKRIQEKDFPDTGVLPVLGDIVLKCWKVEFTSMTEVEHAIEAEIREQG